MCYVHVAALVAEYLRRKGKWELGMCGAGAGADADAGAGADADAGTDAGWC